nr:G4 protein [Bovine leukemia virus]BDT05642.1 G4 protein [Bovine leukemia virus]BDT06226.1 G4 protein [Bovine leukemia virus]BDY33809.1 G4 protein [Bovine leukemia virus]
MACTRVRFLSYFLFLAARALSFGAQPHPAAFGPPFLTVPIKSLPFPQRLPLLLLFPPRHRLPRRALRALRDPLPDNDKIISCLLSKCCWLGAPLSTCLPGPGFVQ